MENTLRKLPTWALTMTTIAVIAETASVDGTWPGSMFVENPISGCCLSWISRGLWRVGLLWLLTCMSQHCHGSVGR